MQSKISLSFICQNISIRDFLKNDCKLSHNQIKKMKLNKKFLDSMCEHKREIELPIDLINSGKVNPEYSGCDIEIIVETNEIIALEKPANIHCHPLTYSDTENCLSFLSSKYSFEVEKVQKGNNEKGLLYRLDFETSGVLVSAKDEQTYETLRNSQTQKYYKAIVSNECKYNGVLENFLVPSGPKGSLMKVDSEGQKAILEILNSKYFKELDCTLVEIKLITGLRHQIRTQLSELGHPIIGDLKYGGRKAKRLYLHACRYIFKEECYTSLNENLFNNILDSDSGL